MCIRDSARIVQQPRGPTLQKYAQAVYDAPQLGIIRFRNLESSPIIIRHKQLGGYFCKVSLKNLVFLLDYSKICQIITLKYEIVKLTSNFFNSNAMTTYM